MALEDRDIFMAICERYKDQPMDYIMAQYALAKKLNQEIEKGLQRPEEVGVEEKTEIVEERQEEAVPPAKRFTKRSLKVKPQEAITDDSIFCCICGLERQNITAVHLAKHGLSVEEYKKICGYPPEQKLMSRRRLAKSREVIGKAQQKRMEKKAVNESFGL